MNAKAYEEEGWAHAEVLRAVEGERSAAQAELAAAQAGFKTSLEAQLARTAAAEQDLDATEVKLEKEEQRAEAAEAQCKQAYRDLVVVRTELQDVKQSRDSWEDRAKKHEAAAHVLATGVEALRSEKGDAMSEADKLRQHLKQESQRAQQLREELAEVKASAAEAAEAAAEEIARLEREAAHVKAEKEAVGSLLREEKQARAGVEKELKEMRERDRVLAQERDEAVQREEALKLKYAELDVFKLDVIARELKGLDTEVSKLRRETQSFVQTAKNFLDPSDKTQGVSCATGLMEMATKMRGHIKDVISKCLSETTKFHIGAAIEDKKAAGVLKEGGVMGGYVRKEGGVMGGYVAVGPPPAEVKSKMHPRQRDEVRHALRAAHAK